VRFETAAAVGARHLPPLAQHLGGAVLPRPYPEDLLFAVPAVVVDVRWALVARSRHVLILEQTCYINNE
jgi:hypothetical protein